MKTIYSPAHYKEERSELITDIIENYGFATLITQNPDGPLISHLPLLLEEHEGKQSLIGHCARANPQWKHFSAGQTVTAIFNGPHAYISPAWYTPAPDNVPTWNYATVHIQGPATLLESPQSAYETLQKLVTKFESAYGTGWMLPKTPNEDLLDLLKAIVAFRIDVQNVDAKFKLSQKIDRTDHATVTRELPQFGETTAALAEYMKRVLE